ncbi:unnamed protein product, partial [Gulo gulo]
GCRRLAQVCITRAGTGAGAGARRQSPRKCRRLHTCPAAGGRGPELGRIAAGPRPRGSAPATPDPAARPGKMRATPLAAPAGAPSRRKRLELDNDLDTESPTRKQARRGPQPRLPPCLLPLSPPPAPARSLTVTTASRLGPYVLLEPEEGGRAYRALHCPTGTEYTCKVGLLGSLPAHP